MAKRTVCCPFVKVSLCSPQPHRGRTGGKTRADSRSLVNLREVRVLQTLAVPSAYDPSAWASRKKDFREVLVTEGLHVLEK